MRRLRTLAAALAALALLAATAAPALADRAFLFADWNRHAWWAVPVQVANELGYLQGYPDNTLRPDADITRAEFAAMLVRAAGYPLPRTPGTAGFSDVSTSDWFVRYIDSLVHFKILRHGDYTSDALQPDEPITRAEMAAWVGRVLAQKGASPDQLGSIQGLEVLTQSALLHVPATPYAKGQYQRIAPYFARLPLPAGPQQASFPDLASSTPGDQSILRAAEYGVVQGFPDGTFRPEAPATRAEAAKVVDVMANEMVANPPTVQQLEQIVDAFDQVGLEVGKALPQQGVTVQSAAAAYFQAGAARYILPQAITEPRGLADGLYEGRKNQPQVWYYQPVPVDCQPIFLGSVSAELDCVGGGTGYQWNGSVEPGFQPAYVGNFITFVDTATGWKIASEYNYAALPPWWTPPASGAPASASSK